MRTKILSITNELVTIDEAKNFLKQVDSLPDLEDELINSLVKTAREYIEKYTGLSLTEKVYELYLNETDLDEGSIELPYSPIYEIQSVKMEDYKGTLTTLTQDSDYYVTGRDKKTIKILTTSVSSTDYITHYLITYKAGYGIAASGELEATEEFPDALKTAILQQVLMWYERDGSFEPVISTQVKMICNEYIERSTLQ